MDPLTISSAALIAVGLIVDLACKLAGVGTVSHQIQALERRRPLLRLLVAAVTLLLFTHLTFELP